MKIRVLALAGLLFFGGVAAFVALGERRVERTVLGSPAPVFSATQGQTEGIVLLGTIWESNQ